MNDLSELPAFKDLSGRFADIGKAIMVAVMKSRAWCNLGMNARRITDRLLVENQSAPRGTRNGTLRVSYRQFKELGIGDRHIGLALNELVEAGLLAVTKGEYRGLKEAPNLYRLTFLGTTEGPSTWKMPEECEPVAEQKRPRKRSFKAKALEQSKAKAEVLPKYHSPVAFGEAAPVAFGEAADIHLPVAFGEAPKRVCVSLAAEAPPPATIATPAIAPQPAHQPKPVGGYLVAGRHQGKSGAVQIEDYTAILLRKGEWHVIDSESNAVPTGRFNDDGTPVEYFSDRMAAWSHIDKLRAVAAGEKINLGMEPVMKTIVRDVIDLTKMSSSKAHTPAGPLPTIEQAAAVVNEAQAATPASPASQSTVEAPFTLRLSGFVAAQPLPENFYTIGNITMVEHAKHSSNAYYDRPGWDDRQREFRAMRAKWGRQPTGYAIEPPPEPPQPRAEAGLDRKDVHVSKVPLNGPAGSTVVPMSCAPASAYAAVGETNVECDRVP